MSIICAVHEGELNEDGECYLCNILTGKFRNPENRLKFLANKYNCDKLHSHSYIPFYSDLFKDMQVKRLLEIGIGFEDLMKPFIKGPYIHGASLKMWEEFFPEAHIFACDIREDTLVNEGRIRSFVCDQSDIGDLFVTLFEIGGRLDVIIDDGSHQTEHQVISAKTLLPFVNKGGVYVIEDCQQPHLVVSELGEGEIYEFGKQADDNLVVVRR
jgi:hypothetical protein